MSRKIESGISTQLNPFGPQWPSVKAGEAPPVGAQIQRALFGKPKPPVLDVARFPELVSVMRLLHKYRKKLAVMAGGEEDDYDLTLADGTIAMIDASGLIYVGASFLQQFAEQHEVLVGVLAHEIGHRPQHWGQYRTQRQLTRDEIEAICRHEETCADIFAGKALAELGFSCEPLIAFLKAVSKHPHPEYFPPEVRAEAISDAHAGRAYRAKARRALFPGFDRMTGAKGHVGDF